MKTIKIQFKLFLAAVVTAVSLNAQTMDWAYTHINGNWNHNVPADLTVDVSGNVYVTGRKYSSGSEDYFTHKLGPAGNLLWAATHNGIMNSDDRAAAIAVDNNGNVYVTGYSYDTVNNQKDMKTIKYNSAGGLLWIRTYNGPGSFDDEGTKIMIDNSGNVIAAGTSYGAGSATDYVVVKYSQAGNILWTSRYNGPANSYDELIDMKLHPSGDIIVTGSSTGTGTGYDYATLRLSISSGNIVWESRYNNPETGWNPDRVIGVAVSSNGDVCVTGMSNSTNGGWDFLTQKYSGSTGGQIWTSRYNGTLNSWDQPAGICADANGNVFVTGMTYETGNLYSITTVIKYNSTGIADWVRHHSGNPNMTEYPKAIALDSEGNPYVIISTNGEPLIINMKLSSQGGNIMWEHNYQSGGYTDPEAIFVDNNGSIFVTAQTGIRSTTIKYSQTMTGIQNNNITAEEFTLQQNYPNPFNPVTKIRFSIPTGKEFATLKIYDAAGKEVSTLVNEQLSAGIYEVSFDAAQYSSGVYFYRFSAGDFSEVKKMVLVK